MSEVEPVSVTGFSQRGSVIDEKHGVIDIVFLIEIAEKSTQGRLLWSNQASYRVIH